MNDQDRALRDTISQRAIDIATYGGMKNPRFEDDQVGVRRFRSDSFAGYSKLVIADGRAIVGFAETQPIIDPAPGRQYDDQIISLVADVILAGMQRPGIP